MCYTWLMKEIVIIDALRTPVGKYDGALSDKTAAELGVHVVKNLLDDIFSANETKRRLMDMGITKRTRVLLRKVAPLGDPLEISLRGYELTLRKSEAQMISVVMLDEGEEK